MQTSSSSSSSTLGQGSRLNRLLGFLQQDPGNALLRADVFDSALAEGRFDIAEQQAVQWLETLPADAPWRHRLALVRIAQKEYAQARQMLSRLIEEGVADPSVPYNLAYAAFREEDFQAAMQVLTRMPESGDAATLAFTLLLRCQHRLGAIGEALTLFESHLAGGAISGEAFGVASLLAVDAGRMAEAAAWSERALAQDPRQLEALVARGSALLAVQDADAAAVVLDRALQVNPDDGRTWSARATASMLQMDLNQALQQYETAVGHLPEHIGTWHGMGWCRLMLKDVAGARKAFERALELDRNFAESHGGLAVVLAFEGRTDEAREAIERACRLDPANLSARYAEAVLSGEAADTARFRSLAQRVLAGRSVGGKSLADVILARRG